MSIIDFIANILYNNNIHVIICSKKYLHKIHTRLGDYMVEPLNEQSLFCRLSIGDETNWIDGILTYVDIEKGVAEVFLSSKYFRSYFDEGSQLIVKSLDDTEEYVFTGTISNRVISIRKQSISIQIDNVIKFANYRQFVRYKASYPTIIKQSKNKTCSALLSDISSGGMLLSSPESFETNASINIEIFFSPDSSLKFVGRIIRKISRKNGFSYGVAIEEIDIENHILLNKLIDNLMSEKKHIFQEWKVVSLIKNSVNFMAIIFIIILFILFFIYKT